MRRYGEALGAEQAGKGRNVVLAPTINLLRTPRWGRAAETQGEDPYLTGRLGAAVVRGLQNEHVMADPMHFDANNQETERFGVAPDFRALDEIVPQRALQELYLPAFKAAVQEGGAAPVMCAYNKVNGANACENGALLAQLRACGFDGVVVSNWYFGVRSTIEAAEGGLDLSMPGGANPFGLPDYYGPPLRSAVEQGRLPMAVLDRMIVRILTAMIRTGLMGPGARTGSSDADVRSLAHTALAAEKGAVLLKNGTPSCRFVPIAPSR